MSEDSSCIAQPMSPSGLAGPSGGSHIDGTLWEERRDHEAVTSKSNQETDHRRRVTRRSRDRSEERVEREMQDIVNEAALRPWTSVALGHGEKEDCLGSAQVKQGNSVESFSDGQSAMDWVTDVKFQTGVAATSSLGSHPGETVSMGRRGVKRKLTLSPVITKSGRVVKKTAVFEIEREQEKENQRKAMGQLKPRAAAAGLEKLKENEGRQQAEEAGPPAKTYFLSGVYSDSWGKLSTKCISVVGDGKAFGVGDSCTQTIYEPATKKAKFKLKWPQPVFFGEFMMKQETHFQLPFGIWWRLNNSKLRVRTVADDEPSEFEYDPPMEYKEIRSNIFVDIKCPPSTEHSLCECGPPTEPGEMGCGDDCLNRMILTECSSKHCPCGDKCSNMRFQKHEWVQKLKKFRTKDRGYGVMTTVDLKANQFLIEYCGEVISEKQYRARVLKKYKRQRHHYCLSLEGSTIIDGHSMGSKARFVNHSCEPNCEMQKWSVNGVDRMGLFALRDIPAGEELTYDYNFDSLDNQLQKCLCGSSKCRGYIGSKNGRSRRSMLLGREFVFHNPCRGQKRKLADNSKNVSDKEADKEKKGKRHCGPKRKCLESRHPTVVKESLVMQRLKSDQIRSSLLYKPLSLRERNCVIQHRIFLLKSLMQTVENFESVLSELKRTEIQRSLSASSYARRGAVCSKHVMSPGQCKTNYSEMQELIVNIFSVLFHYEDENKVNLSIKLKEITARNMMSAHNGLRPPIDISTVESRLLTGEYTQLDDFCADFELALKMAVDHSDSCSRLQVRQCADKLRLLYSKMRRDNEDRLTVALNIDTDSQSSEVVRIDNNATSTREIAIIRCICEMPLDEGFMVQCDRCRAWQHGDCMGYSPHEDKMNSVYYCEKCSYRKVDRNIIERPQPHGGVPGCTYYLTFWHNGSLIKKGGCSYTSRDHSMSWQNGKKRSCNRTLGLKHKDHLDIFRVLGLWQDENFERFVFGFHYFRPHEVLHSAGKRFYPNEVIQTSLYEIIPLEAVVAPCVVMDVYSYARGRPVNVDEQDVYVCELACAKSEPKLKKILRRQIKFPFSTNPAVYEKFSEPIKLHRSVLADANEAKLLDGKRSRKQNTPKCSQVQRSPSKAQAAKRRAAYQEKKVYGPGERVNDIANRLAERVERKQFLMTKKSGKGLMETRTSDELSLGILQTS